MEKIWIMNCPSCSQELPQGLRNKEIMETMNVNCPKCGWKGLAKNTTYKATTYEDWMGPGYTKENSFLSQQEYEELLKDEKGRVNLDAVLANHTPPPQPNKEKSKEEILGEYLNNRFTPQQLETINKRLEMIERIEVDNPEAVEAWNKLKDDELVPSEIKTKWEEALAKKELK